MAANLIPDIFEPQQFHSAFSGLVGPFYLLKNPNYFDDNKERVGALLGEQHTGSPARGHGGVTLTLLDECMGRAASKSCGKLCVTVTLTTHFTASTALGDFIIASAEVSRKGRNIMFVDAQLHRGDKLLASATGTWANTGQPIPSDKTSQWVKTDG